jgi:hypothetical protein
MECTTACPTTVTVIAKKRAEAKTQFTDFIFSFLS